MSTKAISSCLSSKVFPREENKQLVVTVLAFAALACLTASLLSQFHVYSGLPLEGRIALFAISGTVSLTAFAILCLKSSPTLDDSLETYVKGFGYPNATIQKTVTNPSLSLGYGFEDHEFTIQLDGASDELAFTIALPTNNQGSCDSSERLRFRHALFEKKLQIRTFLQSFENYQLSSRSTDIIKNDVQTIINQFIAQKFPHLENRITIENINLGERDFIPVVYQLAPSKEQLHHSIIKLNLGIRATLESLLLKICEDLYQFPSQK